MMWLGTEVAQKATILIQSAPHLFRWLLGRQKPLGGNNTRGRRLPEDTKRWRDGCSYHYCIRPGPSAARAAMICTLSSPEAGSGSQNGLVSRFLLAQGLGQRDIGPVGGDLVMLDPLHAGDNDQIQNRPLAVLLVD